MFNILNLIVQHGKNLPYEFGESWLDLMGANFIKDWTVNFETKSIGLKVNFFPETGSSSKNFEIESFWTRIQVNSEQNFFLFKMFIFLFLIQRKSIIFRVRQPLNFAGCSRILYSPVTRCSPDARIWCLDNSILALFSRKLWIRVL